VAAVAAAGMAATTVEATATANAATAEAAATTANAAAAEAARRSTRHRAATEPIHGAATNRATAKAISNRTACYRASTGAIGNSTASYRAASEARTAREAWTAAKARTTVPAAPAPTMVPAPTIPGPGADEDAANKPVRTVVAVRRACVRIIRVVAIRANRRSSNSNWRNIDADRNLGVCGGHEHQAHAEKCD